MTAVFGAHSEDAQAAGRFAALARGWVVLDDGTGPPTALARVPSATELALGPEHVVVSTGAALKVIPLDGQPSFDVPRDFPIADLRFHGDRLVALGTDGWVSEWELGPPWQVTTRAAVRELAPVSAGVVAWLGDHGIRFLDRDGRPRACEPAALRASNPEWFTMPDPCGADSLRPPQIVLSDGSTVTALYNRVDFGNGTVATEGPVTALASVADLVLVGDLAGQLTAWSPGESDPRARLQLDGPIVALSVEPTRLVVALGDERVIDVDPELILLLETRQRTPSRSWFGP